MARNFKELEARMRPESLARAKLLAKEMMAEMLLGEIRVPTGQTQECTCLLPPRPSTFCQSHQKNQ
jgi:hypothetical protein